MTRTATRPRRILIGLAIAALALPASLVHAASTLAPETVAMLEHMVAEEKLAHDVYTALDALYDVPAFGRIASSESRHTDAVRTLLARYDLADPTEGDAAGSFDHPTFQQMYDDLVAEGSASLAAAAGVGITIEVIDIADLEDALAADPPADVAQVLSRLLAGSENHLAAFEALAADPEGAGTAMAAHAEAHGAQGAAAHRGGPRGDRGPRSSSGPRGAGRP
ncbi:MAG: DUF2202 domain-containing protein [Trueperaceae bacterium]|nr:DUF2202 domain-containing protein [Trueperaceae bacterium]